MIALIALTVLAFVLIAWICLNSLINLLSWTWLLLKSIVFRPLIWLFLTFFSWITNKAIQSKVSEERESFMIDNGIIPETPNQWER